LFDRATEETRIDDLCRLANAVDEQTKILKELVEIQKLSRTGKNQQMK
jgi:hypothetical protein